MFTILDKNPILISILVLALGFILFIPFKSVTIDEHNYLGNAYRIIDGNVKQPCLDLPGQFQVGEFCIYKYNIGHSLFLLPATVFADSVTASIVTVFVLFLVSLFVFTKILRFFYLPKHLVYLFSFYPAFIYLSRTSLSEVTTALLVLISFYSIISLERDSKVKYGVAFGISAGLLVLTRYSAAIIVLTMLFWYLWNIRDILADKIRFLFIISVSAAPFALFFFYINKQLYGGFLDSGYVISGEQVLSGENLISHGLFFIISFLAIYPLMLFFVFFTKFNRKYKVLLLFSILAYSAFYILGPNVLFEGRVLDLVIGVRFFAPIIPFMILLFAFQLNKYIDSKILFKYIYLFGVICLMILSIALQFIHYGFLTEADYVYPDISNLSAYSVSSSL